MNQLRTNWRTTSAGLTMIIGAAVHLIFAVKAKTADENTWTTSLLAIAGGVGLIFSRDSQASAQDKATSNAKIADLQTQVNQVKGDTATLNKPANPT